MAAALKGILGVIPARLGSERLPRKPLHILAGRPLIEWVWRRVHSLDVVDRLVIATDSEAVVSAGTAFGAEVVLTREDHESGTDRISEVAVRERFTSYDVILNVQGDEPFVSRAQVVGAVERVRAGWDIGTVAAPVGSEAEWRDPSVVKVVRNDDGGALYFSRAPIPHLRGGMPSARDLASAGYLRHIGVYAYAREALARWVALPPGQLERTERLEQLRPLAAGLSIGVTVVDRAEGGVDTLEDARRAEARLGQGVE